VSGLKEEQQSSAFDSRGIDLESVSNETNESDLQDEKHDKQRI
jgi:hypothetical protein